MNSMAQITPELATAKPEDFTDPHFIRELEDNSFYAELCR